MVFSQTASACSLEIGQDERMRLLGRRGQRRHKQRCDEKRMIRQLQDARRSIIIDAHHVEPAFMNGCLVGRIETKLAVVLLLYYGALVHTKHPRRGFNVNLHRLPYERASQRRDEQNRGVWI